MQRDGTGTSAGLTLAGWKLRPSPLKGGPGGVVRARGFMSEVVVQISFEESRDAVQLTRALDAFAKWSQESGLITGQDDAPDIMMKTEYQGGQVRRKLVFQNRDHAARFLIFWRTERRFSPVVGAIAAAS